MNILHFSRDVFVGHFFNLTHESVSLLSMLLAIGMERDAAGYGGIQRNWQVELWNAESLLKLE